MRLLSITIAGYILGLLTFYLFASFGHRAWDISYFGWSKVFDAGILMWAVLYFHGGQQIKKMVRWLFMFSFIRILADIQYWFTGIGVNNEPTVAVVFIILISITSYLCLRPEGKAARFLSKHLFKSD